MERRRLPDQTLNLTPYLSTQGLLRRLNETLLEPGENIVLNRGLGYLDLARSRELMFGTYTYAAAARARPTGWVDRPSQSILSLYSVIYGTTGSSFRAAGDTVTALRADSVARAVEANLR